MEENKVIEDFVQEIIREDCLADELVDERIQGVQRRVTFELNDFTESYGKCFNYCGTDITFYLYTQLQRTRKQLRKSEIAFCQTYDEIESNIADAVSKLGVDEEACDGIDELLAAIETAPRVIPEKTEQSEQDVGNNHKTHHIKLMSWLAEDVLSGRKRVEVRENDRLYQAGDLIKFMVPDEIKPTQIHDRFFFQDNSNYYIPTYSTHDKTYQITFVESGYGLKDEYVAFSFKEVAKDE